MGTENHDYDFTAIESHWQKVWDENKTFKAEDFSDKPPYYVLDMFPYPSGAGLHVGHPEGYTASDILTRYKMAKGYNVLHPMGWDAFGLPAEQYAIQTGTHPRETTAKNIENFTRQIKSIGFALDWDREINTTDPEYYKWTQWIFIQLFKKGLAYVDERPVWWCPALGTVLANEEIIDGKSERGAHPVERRALRQWVLKITAYADRLLSDLDMVDWPDSTKRQQAAWIGRSEGAEVAFDIEHFEDEKLRVYTTRPDTLFGVSYMVLAPEHSLVKKLTKPENHEAVENYIKQAATKSDLDRTDLAKHKTGVFTGSYAINPMNGKRIPIWIADYVLMSYGTGAIMAVPAHDERDYEFAQQFDLPILPVIQREEKDGDADAQQLPFSDKGILINSGDYSGLESDEAKNRIIADLEKSKRGRGAVNYKLRDWLFSRQRYWGEPFPIIWVDKQAYNKARDLNGALAEYLPANPVTFIENGSSRYALPVIPAHLPVELPETDDFKPSGTGESPLANCTEWLNVYVNLETGETVSTVHEKPPGNHWALGKRETNTMPQWAGSCWYYLRYCDPKNPDKLIDPKIEKYWGTPDFYIGGAEHAVLHLLYARFWHKFLYDIGVVSEPEPFKKLFHQGIILGEDNNKMSKARGNVVNPDDVIASHGADSLRLYEMFMGPLQDMKPWSMSGIEGVHRFLRRIWRETVDRDGQLNSKITDGPETNQETERLLHETIRKVTEDIENLRFNTAISQMMIFLNHYHKVESISKDTVKVFAQLLAPFAPHIGEELWKRLGGEGSVTHAEWPEFDASKLEIDEVKLIIQVNGKVRGNAMVSKNATQEDVMAIAQSNSNVQSHLEGKTIRKVIYVPGKIFNIVVG